MSFNIGLSGLYAANKQLDVTGNNIANVATTGFKSSRAEFEDVYSATKLGTRQQDRRQRRDAGQRFPAVHPG